MYVLVYARGSGVGSGSGSHTLGCTAWLQCVPGCTVDLVALWAKSKTIDTYIYSLWPNHPKS